MGSVPSTRLRSSHSVAFFGKTLSVECQRCGAHERTSLGHNYCGFVSCPIALIEVKRRQRRRPGRLEPEALSAVGP